MPSYSEPPTPIHEVDFYCTQLETSSCDDINNLKPLGKSRVLASARYNCLKTKREEISRFLKDHANENLEDYIRFHDVCLTVILVCGKESAYEVCKNLATHGPFRSYLLKSLEKSVLKELELLEMPIIHQLLMNMPNEIHLDAILSDSLYLSSLMPPLALKTEFTRLYRERRYSLLVFYAEALSPCRNMCSNSVIKALHSGRGLVLSHVCTRYNLK
ncbi:hypothetical protein TELCIR_07119 [Teladorsagia circumcincta]|uniref:Uncharacterized protein n=1 Tax=Teladorsagia circumcincta TaxID=45464 RepID=A0A2G9ULH3_TELCI|nr:hypothetical protein TELCIR_07119 [Teladorsagia circumcincta]